MTGLPRFDWHMHANYTDGKVTVEECIFEAERKGLVSIALTEHVRADSDWLERYACEVRAAASKGKIKVWCGAEARILNEEGDIHLGKEAASSLDLIVASIHRLPESTTGVEAGQVYCQALANACENPLVDILGHPMHLPKELAGWSMSESDQRTVAKSAARNGVAIEVNRKYDVPSPAFLRICLEEGCLFSMGSDAHRKEDVGEIEGLAEKLISVGVSENDLAIVRWQML